MASKLTEAQVEVLRKMQIEPRYGASHTFGMYVSAGSAKALTRMRLASRPLGTIKYCITDLGRAALAELDKETSNVK